MINIRLLSEVFAKLLIVFNPFLYYSSSFVLLICFLYQEHLNVNNNSLSEISDTFVCWRRPEKRECLQDNYSILGEAVCCGYVEVNR